jgi:hypothetical protein
MTSRLAFLILCIAMLLFAGLDCGGSEEDSDDTLCALPGEVLPECDEYARLHIEFDQSPSVYYEMKMPGLADNELQHNLSEWLNRGCTQVACISFDLIPFDDHVSLSQALDVADYYMDFNKYHATGPDTVIYELHVLVMADLVENWNPENNVLTGLGGAGAAKMGGCAYLFIDAFDYYDLNMIGDDERQPLILNRLLHELGHHLWLDDLNTHHSFETDHSEDQHCVMAETVVWYQGELVYDVEAIPKEQMIKVLGTNRLCCKGFNWLNDIKSIWLSYEDSNPCPEEGNQPYPDE